MKQVRRSVPMLAAVAMFAAAALAAGSGSSADWSVNATVIEACSCPMFCQCYFNTGPAGHEGHGAGGAEHFCRANNAYKINKGHYGSTRLDGLKFWIATDLGGDFSQGKMDWAVLYFDKGTTPEQKTAIQEIVKHVFPVEWKSFKTADGHIDTWRFDKDSAVATLDGGKTAEVRLQRSPGMTDAPVVMHNLRYWGAPRNDGFVMMKNEVEAYRVGDKAFEYKGTNGFMLTFDMSSKDVAKPAGAGN